MSDRQMSRSGSTFQSLQWLSVKPQIEKVAAYLKQGLQKILTGGLSH